MQDILRGYINETLSELGITDAIFVVERPADMAHGDWATNVAMVSAKKIGKNPRALAEEIKAKLEAKNDANISAVEIAGPGFINIKLSKEYFADALAKALSTEDFGKNTTLAGKKVIVEYTDPNPFKEFHIGHLMSNTIGESISRLIEASGADTKRACYQGDVGLHVAKAVWWVLQEHKMTTEVFPDATLDTVGHDWEYLLQTGKAYARGNRAYEANEAAKTEIIVVNKKLYDRSDNAVNQKYDLGKKKSLGYFEEIYKRLGTKFDHYFFESNTGVFGKEVVEKNTGTIFEKSDGAIVYKGDESKGLHTRVFINKEGLPTYEAKELGLAQIKYDTYPYDTSIVITGNEVNDYFKVLLDAMTKVFPELAKKTEHYSHGMLRLPTGKMSSRTGDVITAEAMIDETKTKALTKFTSEFSDTEKDDIAEMVAIGAIKYSILRQAAGKDIIFDFEQSLSFEGDSGPYLQYTHARTRSLLAKSTLIPRSHLGQGDEVCTLHKYILRFPEIVLRAQVEREPHHVATYLIELAREFNAFYANNQIIGSEGEEGKLALVAMTSRILARGLDFLGIKAPERM